MMIQAQFNRPSDTLGRTYDYQWQTLTDIAPAMALAVIAAEDQRFPEHYGFDLTEIKHAWRDYRQGKRLRGASTLTQQVAKNLYLWPERSLLRKLLEAWFAFWIELLWSKERILEIYLNIAQFSSQSFGVAAASQQFFAKSSADLSSSEAALLAAALPAPVRNRVGNPSAAMRQRQQWILQQMQQLGGLSYLQKL